MARADTEPELLDAVATALSRHEAVAESVVVATPAGTLAYVVPDASGAPLLHRACRLEDAGRLDGLCWHEPANRLLVAQLNSTETDFLYREIFADNAYLRHGICLPDDAVVVDVGANIGMFTLFCASHGCGVRIVAVEPVAELARAATVNAELHQADVRVLECALGASAGSASLTYYPGNTAMSGLHGDVQEDREVLRNYLATGESAVEGPQLDALVEDRLTSEERPCQVLTLTEVVRRQKLDRIDLLKIDVEKAESEVLAGVDDPTWELIQQIVIEVHDIDGRLAEVARLLEMRGFIVVTDRDPRMELTPCYNLYGRRGDDLVGSAGKPSSARWATFHALAGCLTDHLGAQTDPGLPAGVPDAFRFVATPPSVGTLEHTDHAAIDPLPSGGEGAAALAEIWADLFGAGSVAHDADFFDLGGDSLTGIRLLTQLEDRFGEEVIAPDVIFTNRRFADLAAEIDAGLARRSTD